MPRLRVPVNGRRRAKAGDIAGDHVFDACVIGGGAAGAVAAAHLVDAGLDVLILEQGPRLPRNASYLDVMRSVEGAWAEDGQGHRSPDGYAWTTCNLGSATLFWGGVAWRYRELDFDCSRHLEGRGLDVRWPFEYAALAPFYDRVERDMGVARGTGVDPTEPPAAPAPLPPHIPSAMGAALAEAGASLGLRPFPTPLAINPAPYGERAACGRGELCIERICPEGAKADVVSVYIDPRLACSNFTVRTRVKVARLVLGRGDSAEAAECLDLEGRRRLRVRARRFLLACNAVQTAVLLLRSRSSRAPRGLGNEHDLVGRGLTYKNSLYLRGRRRGESSRDRAPSHLGPCSTVAFTDHYVDPDIPSGLGGLIYEMAPGPLSTPQEWGSEWLRIECLIGDRPAWSNRVYLADERDGDDLEVPILRYETDPLDRQRLAALVTRGQALLKAAGAVQVVEEPSLYELGSGHLHGTCRAGPDPLGSVVDADGRLHGIANVWVADGSFMPFPGGLNPTLTIQANALRVADVVAATRT